MLLRTARVATTYFLNATEPPKSKVNLLEFAVILKRVDSV